MISIVDRKVGAIMGLAIGDAYGAPYEGGIFEKTAWSIIGKRNGKKRWTDDTQMTIDVIESILKYRGINQEDLAEKFSSSYHWSRGYGPGAAKLLKKIKNGNSWKKANRTTYPEGSFGNGGAMRAPAVGLYYCGESDQVIEQAAHRCSEVTHVNSFGIEGAKLISLVTAYACQGMRTEDILIHLLSRNSIEPFRLKLQKAAAYLRQDNLVPIKTVSSELGNGIEALNSSVTAIYAGLKFRDEPFEDLLEFAIKLGGDVDTIAAMSCAIWGAFNGIDALPKNKLEGIEQNERLMLLATKFANIRER